MPHVFVTDFDDYMKGKRIEVGTGSYSFVEDENRTKIFQTPVPDEFARGPMPVEGGEDDDTA